MAARWPECRARSASRSATAPSPKRLSHSARSPAASSCRPSWSSTTMRRKCGRLASGSMATASARAAERALAVARHPPGQPQPLVRLAPRRIEPARPRQRSDGFAMPADRRQEQAMPDLRLDRFRRQRHGSHEIGLGAFPVPVIGHLQATEHGVGFALTAVDRQRAPRGIGSQAAPPRRPAAAGGSSSTTAADRSRRVRPAHSDRWRRAPAPARTGRAP